MFERIEMGELLGAFFNAVSRGVDVYEADADGLQAYVSGAVALVDAVAEMVKGAEA